MTFRVFDIQGREVTITFLEFDSTLNVTNMRLENVASGFYFIQSGERIWKLLIL